jgi:hypothetical protein
MYLSGIHPEFRKAVKSSFGGPKRRSNTLSKSPRRGLNMRLPLPALDACFSITVSVRASLPWRDGMCVYNFFH